MEFASGQDFEVIAIFSGPYGSLDYSDSWNVADFDGDGRKELVFALGPTVRPDLTLKPADPAIGDWVI